MPVRNEHMTTIVRVKGGTLIEGETLCRTCRWVHMQKGFRESEEAIFCDYGVLRRVRFKVAECTDYLDRTAPTRDEFEKMALLINIEPARKTAGFRAAAGFTKDTDELDGEDSVSSME
jgi:hypothetical protein